MRGPIISTERSKQTLVRGSAPPRLIAPELLEYYIQVMGHPILLNSNS